jgi:hypothetical protein
MLFGRFVNVSLTNDILCKAYDGAKTQQEGKNNPQKLKSSSSEGPVGNSSDQGKKSRVWFVLDMNDFRRRKIVRLII